MIRYALRRMLLMVPTLFVIATLTFIMVRLAPGGPFMSEKAIPAAAQQALRHRYGLDRPLHEQYLVFLGNAARLDLGPSYKYPDREVRDIVWQGFAVSADGRHVVVVATLDNLLKGAATQAVQNLNLAFGLDDTCGLPLSAATEMAR